MIPCLESIDKLIFYQVTIEGNQWVKKRGLQPLVLSQIVLNQAIHDYSA